METKTETGAPWLADERWQNGVVRSTAGAEIKLLVVMAVVWNAFTIPMTLFVAIPEFQKGNHAAAWIGLFVLAGVWLVIAATVKVIQWRRFGTLELVLDPFPGAVGGEVGGSVTVPVHGLVRETVQVTLNCVHVRISGGEHKTRHESVVWRESGTVQPEQGRHGWRIPFRFAVPEGLPDSQPPSNDHHEWLVHVQCRLPGADLDRSFPVPVFEGAPARRSQAAAKLTQNEARDQDVPPQIAQVTRMPRGLSVFYPPRRNLGTGLTLSIFGAAFGGLPAFILYKLIEGGQADNGFGMFFVGVGGFVGLVFGIVSLLLLVSGIYLLGNSLQVTIGSDGVSTLRRIYGIPVRRHVAREEVVDLDTTITGQQGQGTKASVRYTLRAKTRNGGTVTVGDGVRGVTIAKYLTRLMRESLRLPAESPAHTGYTSDPE